LLQTLRLEEAELKKLGELETLDELETLGELETLATLKRLEEESVVMVGMIYERLVALEAADLKLENYPVVTAT